MDIQAHLENRSQMVFLDFPGGLDDNEMLVPILVPRSRYQDLDAKILISRFWYQDLASKILVPKSLDHDLGTKIIGVWYPLRSSESQGVCTLAAFGCCLELGGQTLATLPKGP